MAWAFEQQHTLDTDKVSGTGGAVVTLAASVPAGKIILVGIVFDNLTATTPVVSSIAKQSGETNNWQQIGFFDAGASAAGYVRGELWGIETTTTWSAASYAITLSGAVVAKAVAPPESLAGGTLTLRGTVAHVDGATGNVSVTTTGTAPVNGDLVVGLCGYETNVAPGGDTDTTNGSWSAIQEAHTTGGGAATNVAAGVQFKIVTADGHQTFDTTGANESGALVLALQPAAGGPTTHSADGSLIITADRTGTGASDKPVTGNLTVTASLTGTAASDKPVSGNLTVTAARSGDATVGAAPVEVDGNLTVTATATGTGAGIKPVDGSLAVTASRTGTAATDKPVSGSLTVTATRTGTVATAQPVDGSRTTTVAFAGTGATTKPVDGTRPITVGLTGDATVGAPPVTVDGSLTITAGRTSTTQAVKPVDGDRATTVGFTSASQLAAAISGTVGITASRTATVSVDRSVDGVLALVVALMGEAAGATVKAISTAAVTASRTSVAAEDANQAGISAVAAQRTSSSTVG